MWTGYFGEAVTAGCNPGVTKKDGVGIPCHRLRLKEDGNYSDRTCAVVLATIFPPAVFLVSWFPLDPLVFFVAQNLRIQLNFRIQRI